MTMSKSPPRRSAAHAKLVLLVGGDQSTARSCARAACPLPVIHTKRVGNAADHLRSMHPVALVVAADVTVEDAAQLERIADGRARVIHLDAESDLDADIRKAVANR